MPNHPLIFAYARTRSFDGLNAGASALSDFLGVDAAADGVLLALALALAVPFAVVVMGGGFRLLLLLLLLLLPLPPSFSAAAGAVAAAAFSPPSELMSPLPLWHVAVREIVRTCACVWIDGSGAMAGGGGHPKLILSSPDTVSSMRCAYLDPPGAGCGCC
jgi:hypothetical protein